MSLGQVLKGTLPENYTWKVDGLPIPCIGLSWARTLATFWELRHLLSLTCNPKLKMDESDCPFQLGDFQVQCSIFSGVFSSISFSRIFPNIIWSMSFFCRFPTLVLGNHLTLMSSWTDLKLNHFSKFSCISSLGKKTKIFRQKNTPPTLQKNHT